MSKIRTLANDAISVIRHADKKSSRTKTRQAVEDIREAVEMLAMAVKDLDRRLDKMDRN